MCAKMTGSLENLAVVGVDLGKDTFHLVGFDRAGQLVMRKQIKRLALRSTFEQLPRCIVGMEACLSVHFVSRTLRGMGFEPRIIPAIYVKPFNKGQKNDYNDAEAIAEAALRPNLRSVSEKDQDPLDLQALHRVRARLVSRRTASINQIRAFLIEQGITVRSGLRALKNSFETILEQRRGEISPRMRGILIGLYGDWLWLDKRIEDVSGEIEEISRTEENCANIMTIPGIGPMISTAMVAAVGKGEAFDRGRDFPGLCGVGRFGADPIQHGRENDPRADHQTGQPLSSHAVRPGGEGDHDASEQVVCLQLRRLADRSGEAHAAQQGSGCAGQQTCPNRVERSATRAPVRRPKRYGHGNHLTLSTVKRSSRQRGQ